MVRLRSVLFVLLLFCSVAVKTEDGYFYGGSISYKLEQIAGKKIAHVELITGWTLGQGPCGVNCSKKDVNTITNNKRESKEISTGKETYFGNFTTDYKIKSDTRERDLNKIVRTNYTEWVIAVNEHAKWEQELMKFSFEMAEASEDISFDGESWRPLMNKTKLPWHFQTKVDHSLRSDTQNMNNCPQVFTKTFYRVKLNKVSTIQIPMIDPDGDVVRCSRAEFIEGGHLPPSPGVTVHDESDASVCKVSIDAASSLGYSDDTWIAIPIRFGDYNTGPLKFGDYDYQAGSFSLSTSSAQFAVQILQNLVTPEFVFPTIKGDHMFIVYAGSTWSADIYAEAPLNTTIDEFIPYGRNRENIILSNINDDTSRELVKYTTMSWTPALDDTEQHILCISAVDNTGVDTDELRCFTVEVRVDTFNHSSSAVTGKPYFIDIPSYEQFVNCKVDATCLIPVFVKSSARISEVRVTDSYTDEASVGNVETVTHKGDTVYKVILSFTHSMPGVEKICLLATDINNVTSEEVCISSEIQPPDPCLSAPCKNSATCSSNKRTGTFVCECLSDHITGTFCEIKASLCNPDSCIEGQTQQCLEAGMSHYCLCKKGFTGIRCETNIYDCITDSCNATTGTCRDLLNDVTCDCYQRYNGTNCSIDNCPGERNDVITCPAVGCSSSSCSGNGVCSNGGVCTCRRGFSSDPNCLNSVDTYPGVSGVQFVPPTPMDKSRHTCIIVSNKIQPCYLSLFVATNSRAKPTLNMETTSDLSFNSTLGTVEPSSVLEGFSNIFSADIVIRGNVTKLNGHYVCVTANDGSSSAELCLELNFVSNPFQANFQKNAVIKFVEPTQVEGSKLVGYINETYTVILFTTRSSSCENVISTSEGTTVFPAVDGSGKCVTEASFQFTTVGIADICFQSARTSFQKRCFKAEGLNIGSDPCSNSPCQNKGHCFPDETKGFRCICHKDYIGDKCEEGPCPTNICLNGAYCKINDGQQTCVCKAGFTGTKCELKSSENKPEMTFTCTAKPRQFQCVIYQPCSVALLLTGEKQSVQRPAVSAGYVSPTIMLNDIDVIDVGSSGSFKVDIGLKAKEVGIKDVCIQTVDLNGINKDELCFKVEVITEVSTIYGFKDRPHFIFPSLPMNASIECPENGPCHVMYEITPGKGNEKQCVSVGPTGNIEIQTYHIFTSCEPCTPGQANTGNCTVDISLITSALDVGKVKHFCVAARLVDSHTLGEERCFNLSVISKTKDNEKEGCQLLECKNGGFCNGQIPDKPVCYCKNGFSGRECEKAGGLTSAPSSHSQSFIGDLSIPSEIKCKVDQTCSIQFQIVTAAGEHPLISVGFSDPTLSAGELSYALSGNSNSMYTGSVDVHPTKEGTFHVCLQTNDNSKTVEELCVAVQVSDASLEHKDTSKPHFVSPTLPKDSTVLCQENTWCHLDLHVTNGDQFGFAGKCPSLTETSTDHVSEIHVFPSVYQSKSCTSDVTYKSTTSSTYSLCFQIALPGKKGENRCYTIRTIPDVASEVSSPCTGVTCEHGGKCIADLTARPAKRSCICAIGFSGNNCNIAVNKTTGLPGVDHIPRTLVISQHFDSNSGIPTNVKCDKVNPCCVVIPYHGDKAKPPLLGFKDPALTITLNQTVTPDKTQQDFNLFQTCFTGSPGEKHRMCLQTTTNGTRQGMNVEEICFEAEFETGGQDHSSTEPKFTNSLSNGSSVSCQPKTVCHIPVETDQKSGTCEQVKECGEGVPNTFVFNTIKVGDKCITDIAVRTSEQGHTDKLCISAGSDGEQREIMVLTEKSDEFGPCQKLHCLHGGFCNSTSSTSAVCDCTFGFTGELCQHNVLTTPKTTTITTTTNVTVQTSSSVLIVHSESSTISSSVQPTNQLATKSTDTSASTGVTSDSDQNILTSTSSSKTTLSSDPTTKTDISSSIDVTQKASSIASSMSPVATPSVQTAGTHFPAGVTPLQVPAALGGHIVSTDSKSSTSAHKASLSVSSTFASNIVTNMGIKTTSSGMPVFNSNPAEKKIVTQQTARISTTSKATGQKSSILTQHSTVRLTTPTGTKLIPSGKTVGTSNTTEQCDNKKAKEHAETIVRTGYASCFCFVRGKKVYVIKKRPVAQKENMIKAAGFGAGGMAGTMLIGVVIFAIVNKVRQPAVNRGRVPPITRRPPSKSRVHPQSKPKEVPTRQQLKF